VSHFSIFIGHAPRAGLQTIQKDLGSEPKLPSLIRDGGRWNRVSASCVSSASRLASSLGSPRASWPLRSSGSRARNLVQLLHRLLLVSPALLALVAAFGCPFVPFCATLRPLEAMRRQPASAALTPSAAPCPFTGEILEQIAELQALATREQGLLQALATREQALATREQALATREQPLIVAADRARRAEAAGACHGGVLRIRALK
jgi:hypothetical protein